MNLVNVY